MNQSSTTLGILNVDPAENSASTDHDIGRSQGCTSALNGIMRQLGLPICLQRTVGRRKSTIPYGEGDAVIVRLASTAISRTGSDGEGNRHPRQRTMLIPFGRNRLERLDPSHG